MVYSGEHSKQQKKKKRRRRRRKKKQLLKTETVRRLKRVGEEPAVKKAVRNTSKRASREYIHKPNTAKRGRKNNNNKQTKRKKETTTTKHIHTNKTKKNERKEEEEVKKVATLSKRNAWIDPFCVEEEEDRPSLAHGQVKMTLDALATSVCANS